MGIVEDAIRGSRRFLEDGEVVHGGFVAYGRAHPRIMIGCMAAGPAVGTVVDFPFPPGSHYLPLLVWLPLSWLVGFSVVSRRVVVVTDRSVVVLSAWPVGSVAPRGMVARLPRETSIGPLQGTWARVDLGGHRLWINKALHYRAAILQSAGTAAPDEPRAAR